MKLLVLSFYFRPDLSAGSFRTTALVTALRDRVPSGTTIDVLCAQPSRYRSFTPNCPETELDGNVSIRRIALPAYGAGAKGQARIFLHFAREASKIASTKRYDVVFATSSRLLTAALGASIARKQGSALYLDIRDIMVDTIKDVVPSVLSWPSKVAFSLIESWTVRRADRVNLVSRGFEGYFKQRYADLRLSWFTNGIDDEFLAHPPHSSTTPKDTKVTILYAGNIGDGQGLHIVLPRLANALHERARFILIGDGGKRTALESALNAAEVKNVELRSPMSRDDLIQAYAQADVLFLHLNALPAFEKVLPSKVFEYAATGKPILAGVAGYAAQFIRTEIHNAAVFTPCDVDSAVRAFEELKIAVEARPEFIRKYSRTSISSAMADDILACTRKI